MLLTDLPIARFFLGLLTAAGNNTYPILLAITIAAWLFVFFLAPETMNLSLEELQGFLTAYSLPAAGPLFQQPAAHGLSPEAVRFEETTRSAVTEPQPPVEGCDVTRNATSQPTYVGPGPSGFGRRHARWY
ncbi:hypothetical protein ACWD3Z_39780 [Streptomyces sp. NPDC002740]